MQTLCITRYTHVNLIEILVTFVHRINKQEKYCLFFARTLISKYSSRIDDRMQIERTSNMLNMLEESALHYNIFLH